MRLLVALGLCLYFVGMGHAQETSPTLTRHLIRHDGLNRYYLLYIPSTYSTSQPVPLVLLFHGGGGHPEQFEEAAEFSHQAEQAGFILAYPAGNGVFRNRLLTWNAGHCCAYALENQIDDVGFVREVVADIQADYAIDPTRIYAAGHSNGAILSYRLAAEMSDIFAAVGIMAGTIGGKPSPDSDTFYQIPTPANPVSVIHIHGMMDENLRYEGGINNPATNVIRDDLSVADSMAFWAHVNQCEMPVSTRLQDGMVLIDDYACPATNTAIKLITIVDGGHSWAGSDEATTRMSDEPSQRVSATQEIWAFFSQHVKP